MGRITDEDIARVRDATDLAAVVSERVVLRPKGRLQWGNCPFHGEKTPSFKVDPATQLWHCFGCGAGGDVFGYVMRSDNVDFPDAVRILADRANIEIAEAEGGVPRGRKERLFAALDEAATYYQKVLTGSRDAKADEARSYLAGRGFGSKVAKDWTLGYAPGRGALVRHLMDKGFSGDEIIDANLALKSDNGQLRDRFYERIMFPIRDLQGRVVAFGGRVLGKGEPKYLNTNDTPVFHKSANMYGIDRAKGPITASGTAAVVEGYTDVIALHEAGMPIAVATLGTALTKQHVKLLGRFARRVVYLFDGDEAGMRAADRAAEFVDSTVTPEAGASRVELAVAVIPEGLDPADFVAKNGAEAMREVIESAQPLLRFAIDRRLNRWDLERPEERARALKDAAEVLVPVRGSILADDYANYIADKLFADFDTVRRAVSSAKAAPSRMLDEDKDATSALVSAMPAPATPQGRAERDMIALMVRMPSVRARAQELLAESLLSGDEYRRMAEVIAEAGEGLPADALAGRLQEQVPGSAEVLAAVEYGEEPAEEVATLERELVRRLKEFELERRIAVGKGRLKRPESFKEPAEYDDLFRELAVLERKLSDLRSGAEE